MVSESGTVVAPEQADDAHDLQETLIHPREGWESLQLVELWKCRHLIYFLTWRDLKVRYKQTVLGALWAILQPVLMMVVFAQVFGGMVGQAPNGLPYSIFVYAGLLPWTFVSQAVSKAAMSVASQEKLVEKIYFPRLVFPISAVAQALVDFGIAFIVLILMMIWHPIIPPKAILLLPVAIGLLCLVSLGIGILYAALNITYRDFRHLIVFLIQIWMFATPSIYDPDALMPSEQSVQAAGQEDGQHADSAAEAKMTPRQQILAKMRGRADSWFSVLDLNPLTAIVEFFRATVLGGPIPWFMLAKSTIFSSILLVIGLVYFRRTEDVFADII